MGFLGFGKKKITKKEFVEGVLRLEPDWTKRWLKYFNKFEGVPGISLEAHIISLFSILSAMPTDETVQIMYELIYERIEENDELMEFILSRFKKYQDIDDQLLPESMISSINNHLDSPITMDITIMIDIRTKLSNQIKATGGMVLNCMEKFIIKDLTH